MFYNGYLSACERAVQDVVARYSRGNTSVQDRRFMTEVERAALHDEAERAANRLAIRVGRTNR
jgi:hypothetical protein